LLRFWKAGSLVRSYSGPEVKIVGREGRQIGVEKKKPQPGMVRAKIQSIVR